MFTIYHSLDFASARSRIESNDPGDYLVHCEDFENINDLVKRSLITRDSSCLFGRDPECFYDDALNDPKLQDDYELSSKASASKAAQQEAKASSDAAVDLEANLDNSVKQVD
ncbi:hypothetical protein [Capybara microvirus Cap3_SP_646]|nr:hypothetical protein [Capybara microvirus Cap3_SP_646]